MNYELQAPKFYKLLKYLLFVSMYAKAVGIQWRFKSYRLRYFTFVSDDIDIKVTPCFSLCPYDDTDCCPSYLTILSD